MLFGKKSKTINDIPNDIPKRKIVFDGMILDDEQVSAFDEINNSNGNFFITGKAGTGKSLLLQYFITKTDKNVVVLAPTGIAAINIHGQTIHSFFGLKPQIQNVSENSQTFVNNQQRTLRHIKFTEKAEKLEKALFDTINTCRMTGDSRGHTGKEFTEKLLSML